MVTITNNMVTKDARNDQIQEESKKTRLENAVLKNQLKLFVTKSKHDAEMREMQAKLDAAERRASI